MDTLTMLETINQILLEEVPELRYWQTLFSKDIQGHRLLMRALMNVQEKIPKDPRYCPLQDALLQELRVEKGEVDVQKLRYYKHTPFCLWQGDITTLKADVIVNAANQALLGCFHPLHGCIDNAIHSAAGLELREECRNLMEKQGQKEPIGAAKITKAYALPCRYILHTVGPCIHGAVSAMDQKQLASCYHSCLQLAYDHHVTSIVFCCISTGEFHFPNPLAARIAIQEASLFLSEHPHAIRIVFNVFHDEDRRLYETELDNLHMA